jgi:hypothetical protein
LISTRVETGRFQEEEEDGDEDDKEVEEEKGGVRRRRWRRRQLWVNWMKIKPPHRGRPAVPASFASRGRVAIPLPGARLVTWDRTGCH